MAEQSEVGGVSLREYIELLVDARTNEIKVLMAERLQAVQTAYEQHQGQHKVVEKDMEHLNGLRQEVTRIQGQYLPIKTFEVYEKTSADSFDKYSVSIREWMSLMGGHISSLRGQIVGAGAVLGIVFTAVQIALAIYGQQ